MATIMNTIKTITTPALHLTETTAPPTTPPSKKVLEDRNAVETTFKDGSNAAITITSSHEVTTPPTITRLTTPPMPTIETPPISKLPEITIPSTAAFESQISGPSTTEAHVEASGALIPMVDKTPFKMTELNSSSSISPLATEPTAIIPPSATNPKPHETQLDHFRPVDIVKALLASGIESLEPEIVEELEIVHTCRETGLDVDGTPFNPATQALLCQYGLQHFLRQHSLNEYRHKPLGWHSVGAQLFGNENIKAALLIFHPDANEDDLDIATLRAIEKADDPYALLKRHAGPIMNWYLAKTDASGRDNEDESESDAVDSTPAAGPTTDLNPRAINPPAVGSSGASSHRPPAAPVSSTYNVQDYILDLSHAGPSFETLSFPPRPSTIIAHPGHITINERKERLRDPIFESIAKAVISDVRAGRFGRPYPPFYTKLGDDSISFVIEKGEVKRSAWAGNGSYYYIVAKATKKVLGGLFAFIDCGYFKKLIMSATTNLVLGTIDDVQGFYTRPMGAHASGIIAEALILLSVQTTTDAERQKWEEDYVIPVIERSKAELDILDPSPMQEAQKKQLDYLVKMTTDALTEAATLQERKGSGDHTPFLKRQCTSGVM